jgi:hypothetical protein
MGCWCTWLYSCYLNIWNKSQTLDKTSFIHHCFHTTHRFCFWFQTDLLKFCLMTSTTCINLKNNHEKKLRPASCRCVSISRPAPFHVQNPKQSSSPKQESVVTCNVQLLSSIFKASLEGGKHQQQAPLQANEEWISGPRMKLCSNITWTEVFHIPRNYHNKGFRVKEGSVIKRASILFDNNSLSKTGMWNITIRVLLLQSFILWHHSS